MKNKNTPPIMPAYDASTYSIYKADRFVSSATARKYGIAWFGHSLKQAKGKRLFACFDAAGIEISGLLFDPKNKRFKQY